MAEAKLYKGANGQLVAHVAYVGDTPVDSEGREVKGAPKRQPDTKPEDQPTNVLLSPEEKMANAFALALAGQNKSPDLKAAKEQAKATALSDTPDAEEVAEETDSDEEEGLPSLADMPAHLHSVTDVDEVRSMRRQDKRKGAKPLYAARIAELEAK